jgi:peptidoglycan-associated lipoprotein
MLMTSVRRYLWLFLLCVTLIGVTACGRRAPSVAPAPPPPPTATPSAPPAPPPPPSTSTGPGAPTISEQEIFNRKTLEELNAERPLGDIYFDLDQSNVRDDGRGTLQKNADWLKRWPTTRITVEGHCDSRGTSEYNLGLGERRATAVRDYLASLGIPANRINTVSKGKEQPFCTEENETCWAQNRRGHFIITAK